MAIKFRISRRKYLQLFSVLVAFSQSSDQIFVFGSHIKFFFNLAESYIVSKRLTITQQHTIHSITKNFKKKLFRSKKYLQFHTNRSIRNV